MSLPKSKEKRLPKRLVGLFRALGQPARLRVLLALGGGEACVCHLETVLGQRQAYISQQLMALRSSGLVAARREGRNIYYRLSSPELVELIQHAASVVGVPQADLHISTPEPQPACACPYCADGRLPSEGEGGQP